MAQMVSLQDLLQHEIEDLYSAEEQIIAALPKMIEKATDRELKKALNEHLQVTIRQKDRLDQVREAMGEPSEGQKGFLERILGTGTKCKGTEGLIKEGEKMMSEDMDSKVMDAAIIGCAQKIEHYEISGYGTARAYARELGLNTIQKLLEATLAEEYFADDSLTALAVGKVNVEADTTGGRRKTANSSAKKKVSVKKVPVKKTAPKKSEAKKSATKSSSRPAKKVSPKKGAPRKRKASR